MPRYKTRTQTALASSSEVTHPNTTKRKLKHAKTENQYSEEPGVPQTSERNSKKKDVPSKDVNSQKKLTNLKLQQKLPSAKSDFKDKKSQVNSSNSNPELMTPKEVLQLLNAHNHKDVVLSPTNMEDCEFSVRNSNPDDLDSQVPNTLGCKQITPELKNVSRKYKTRTKFGSPKTRQRASTMSRSIVTESNIPCARESIMVTPKIKRVAQAYSRATDKPSKTYEKIEESPGLLDSTSPDIAEMIDIFNQVKQYCFKTKRPSSRKTKLQDIESVSSTSNTGYLESNIPCVEEPSEVIKHVPKTCAGTKKIPSTTCKTKKNYQNTSSSSCLNVTNTNNVTAQVKTDLCSTKKRKTKASSNLNTDNLEFNICNSEEPTEVTTQIKHVSQTYAGTRKKLSATCKENDSYQNTSINLCQIATETNDVTAQVKTKLCSAKGRKTKDSLNLNTGCLESNICNIEEPIDVIPQIKYVARTYSRATERLSKTLKKNDESQSFSINLNLGIPESEEYFPQGEQCGVKKHSTRNVTNVQKTNKSKNNLLNSFSEDFESKTDVQGLNDEVSPQIKQCAAKKHKRKSLANIKRENKISLLNSLSDDFESSIGDAQELNDEVPPQIKQRASKKRKKPSLADVKRMNKSKNSLLDSISDCESSIADVQELNDEVSLQIKHSAAKKRKKQSLANIKQLHESKNGSLNSISYDCESSSADVQELNDEESPQIKPLTRKCKKVGFASLCVDELIGSSSNSTIDVLDSEMPMDFLPIITESCKNRLKSIVSTAVEIQRHSQRQILTETDFIKALAFHNYFENDITELEMDSETLRNEDNEFASLTCRGKWLYK